MFKKKKKLTRGVPGLEFFPKFTEGNGNNNNNNRKNHLEQKPQLFPPLESVFHFL